MSTLPWAKILAIKTGLEDVAGNGIGAVAREVIRLAPGFDVTVEEAADPGSFYVNLRQGSQDYMFKIAGPVEQTVTGDFSGVLA